jgi:glyoxylase-like metal-dependent hydrolase (beta-lactamase superfamily II)
MRRPVTKVVRLLLIAATLGVAACGSDDSSSTAPLSELESESVINRETDRSSDNEQVQNRGAENDRWWDELPRPEWGQYTLIPQDQDWFEVYRVADGIFAIYEPGQFEEVISFLILGEKRALLFDTGLGIGDIRRLVDGLTDLEVIVLNSHTHYDHIGGNYQFDSIYALDTEYTRRNSQGSTTGAVAEFIQEGWVWKPFPDGFSAEDFRSRPFGISRFVTNGERIDIGGRVLEVLATPGHAPDALCIIDRENRLLFTGDTFYLAPLYTHLEGSDFDEYARTAVRIAGMSGEIDALMTAHNVPIADSSYAIALGRAFTEIQSGRAQNFTLSDGLREYHFDGFSVLTNAQD